MNEFEKYKNLADHMERMASTGSTGSPKQWQEFTTELNKALIQNHGVIGDVIVFSPREMWNIDGRLVVGSHVTDKEKEYYNKYFDEMVSETQDDCDHWKHHSSIISN